MIRAAYAFTLLTGASGLVYQITWQRYLGRLLGGDRLATSIVLGVFLGGLSLGYVFWGRLSARTDKLFLVYGALEGVIGLWALGFPWIFGAVDRGTSGWGFEPRIGLLVQGSSCAVVLIGIPTLCMGATVPLLTRALSASAERSTSINARIYALNTAGAVVGTLAAGFLALRWLGLPGTLRAAGAMNLGAAVFFAWVGRRVDAPIAPDGRRTGRPSSVAETSCPRAMLVSIGFLAGFAFMTLEVLVIRLAKLSVGPSTFTLSLVIAAFLLCIAGGAWIVGRRRALSPSALALNQAVATLALLPVFLTLDKWPYAAHWLRIQFGFGQGDFVLYQLSILAGLCLLLALPVGCMGATLPLAFAGLRAGLADAGRAAGGLFAWNAAGNLLGGLIGGFLVYRSLGLGEVFLLVAVLTAVTAWMASAGLAVRVRAWAGLPLAFSLLFAWIFPAHDPLRFAVGTFQLHGALDCSGDGPRAFYAEFYASRTVVAYRDDPEATLAVVENPSLVEALQRRFPSLGRSIVAVPSALGEEGPRPRSIVINGKADSSTFYDRETLRLAAHLPALLASRRDRVLVIGLGTGVTVGELARYPDVRSIDVAEISPGVVRLLPLFGEWTGAVQDDARLHVSVGDAFRVLRRSDERWNLIVSEPSNPWTSGVDQLFSREFYRLVREHLERDGIFLCWIQRYATNRTIAGLALNTLRSEFPHVRVFRAGSDDLLVASMMPITDAALTRADATLRANEAVRASLAEIRVNSAADLLAREHPEVIGQAAAVEHLGVETLDRPRIHFLAGLALFRGDDPDALAASTDGGSRRERAP